MQYVIDHRVDDYIDALPAWQQEICQEVRALLHAADSDVLEKVKHTVQPHFVLDGDVCALSAADDRVNVHVYGETSNASDPEIIAFGKGEPIDRPALAARLQRVIARNRAQGWRKLQPSEHTEMSDG